jgi:putative oxidoreductase
MLDVLDRYSPIALAALRIVAALAFMEHGTQKLLGFPAPPDKGLPALLSLSGIGGMIELFGGALLLIGLFTRPVAFILSGEMAVAYWMAHAPRSFFPVLNGGDAAILYCFIFLLFVFTGPGAWSVDGILWSKRSPS